MKFIIPATQTPAYFLHDIVPYRNTWEYRAASLAVIVQFFMGGLAILWFWRHLPPAIPLWYSRPWGEDRFASPWFLLLPITTALLVYGMNLICVARFGAQHPMFARTLFLTSLLVSSLSVILIIRILLLVG